MVVWRDRIYLDDCETLDNHYYDQQWTWYPNTPKLDGSHKVQGTKSIYIESDIYRIAHEWTWGYAQRGWVFNDVYFDPDYNNLKCYANGSAYLPISPEIVVARNWNLLPGLVWNTFVEDGSGMASNNNFYMYGGGATIGLHQRCEIIGVSPSLTYWDYYAYLTVDGNIVDTYYLRLETGGVPGPDYRTLIQKVGNSYTVWIRYWDAEGYHVIGSMSTSVAVTGFTKIELVGPSANPGLLDKGITWEYAKSYGTSYIYKDIYAAGIDQKDLIFCDTVNYAIRADMAGTYLKFCLGYNSWDEWESDVTIFDINTWEYKSVDISNVPLPVKKNGFKYVGFKFVHDQLETIYSDFVFRYDKVYCDPTEYAVGDAIIF